MRIIVLCSWYEQAELLISRKKYTRLSYVHVTKWDFSGAHSGDWEKITVSCDTMPYDLTDYSK
jgi:hypothetical protein